MPTYDSLITHYEIARDAAHERGQVAHNAIAELLDHAKRQGRASVSTSEERSLDRLFHERERARISESEAQTKIDTLSDARAEDDIVDQRLATTAPRNPRNTAAMPSYDRVARVGREERTYRPDADPTGKGFLLDIARSHMFADVRANERLGRHMHEEETERGGMITRSVGTSGFVGLVVPSYLTDLYAPAIAALAPLEDIATAHDLPPDGMTLNISRITTPTATGLQTTELTAVTEQNIDDTLLTVNVQTIAGQQTVSRQAIERGTGIEDVTTKDLFDRYATTLDSTLINQAATGLTNCAQITTYTSAAPTAAELYPYLFQAQSKLESALLGRATVDYVAMHSRRWNWLCSQVSSSWPLFGTSGVPPQKAGVTITNEYGPGVRGVLSNGLRVIVDNNIAVNLGVGTNQDEIYLLSSSELHVWETPSAPLLVRAEQPQAANLGVVLVVYGYVAMTAQRYANNPGKISGTGLIAPAGF